MTDALYRWKHTSLISRLRISEQESMKSVPVTAGKLKAHYMQHNASHALLGSHRYITAAQGELSGASS